MLNELKKRTTKRAVTRIGLSFIALIIILAVFGKSMIKITEEPKDLYSIKSEEIPGAYVKGDIYALIDAFAEYYTENRNGSQTTTQQYYIIPVGEEEYAAIEISKKDFSLAEQIYDETYDYLTGATDTLTTSIAVTGSFTPMDTDIRKYFEETLADSGYFSSYSAEEIEELVYPYVLQIDYIGSYHKYMVYGSIILSGIIIFLILITFIKLITGAYLAPIHRYLNSGDSGVSQERAEVDYENAVIAESIRVGETWTYFFEGIKPRILKNSDIIWAYQETVNHKYYGIKTRTTRSIILYNKNKLKYTVRMKKIENIEQILETYTRQQPHIVVGFNKELKTTFNKEFDEFLNLAYNQNKQTAEY